MNIQSVAAAYGAQYFQPVAKSNKTAAPVQTAAVSNEQVEISDKSSDYQTVREAVNALPDIRIPLVENLKNKIKMDGYPFETNIYKALSKIVDYKIV